MHIVYGMSRKVCEGKAMQVSLEWRGCDASLLAYTHNGIVVQTRHKRR